MTPAPGVAHERLVGWAAIAAMGLWWLVTSESGQVLGIVGESAADAGGFLHELMHDGRHVLGGPCH
jgi:hypothetical protein